MDISAIVTPIRRRRRPAVSCTPCRKRKVRCNREYPCSSCEKTANTTCVYDGYYRPPSTQQPGFGTFQSGPGHGHGLSHAGGHGLHAGPAGNAPLPPTSSLLNASSMHSGAQPSSSSPSSAEVESMKTRIQQLEEHLSRITASKSPSEAPSKTHNNALIVTTSSSSVGGTYHIEHDRTGSGQGLGVSRCVAHKRRLFGQSHWIHAAVMFRDIIEMTETCINNAEVISGLNRCKTLSKIIKAERTPPWPSPPTLDLPDRAIADVLVNAYLRTFETVYRILHIPTFQQDYERIWSISPGERKDNVFLIQLKLVLALGAVVHDDTFSMRASAIQWTCEAQTWAAKPVSKSRLDIPSTQIGILLVIAREIVGVGGDSIWIAAGALFRTAIHMGLHRDAAYLPPTSLYVAEMRRRLWNTILEMMMQSSMALGTPPLFSLEDFDTEPPGNYDDEQIPSISSEDEQQQRPSVPTAARPEHEFTQVSAAIALRRTLPARLAVARYLNQLGSQTTYTETLALDKELKSAYRDLCRTLKGPTTSGLGISPPPPSSSSSTGSQTRTASLFTLRFVDYVMHRYMVSLHIPFFGLGLSDAAYAYSRKTAVDLALKAWPAVHPSTAINTDRFQQQQQQLDEAALSAQNDLARLICCGTGFFRSTAKIVSLVAMAELRATVQEEPGLLGGPASTVSRDVLSVREEAKEWAMRCIRAGEVNVKGLLLQTMLATHINWLMRGEGKERLPELMVRAAEEVNEACLPILEAAAGEDKSSGGEETGGGLELGEMNLSTDDVPDWTFMMSNILFDSGNIEPMSWGFVEGGTSELLPW